jgi:deoxyribodipyrimidine photo-lyase
MLNKKFEKSVFVFRRDLRLTDNTGLIHALQMSKHVIPIFIFDPNQINKKNIYKSNNALQFMIDSILGLEEQLKNNRAKLYTFYGNPDKVVEKLITQEKIAALFVNQDYTPYSKSRDAKIKNVCSKHKVAFHEFHDLLLTNPNKILKKDGKPYAVFTPFFRRALLEDIPDIIECPGKNFYKQKISGAGKIESICKKILPQRNSNVFDGGRKLGLKILKDIKRFKDYKSEHDFPGLNATTKLSAHNKFGTVSIRQTYHTIRKNLGKNHPLIRQLFWRDFFTHIAFHFPHVFGNAFHEKYNSIKWENNLIKFKAWCDGKTGFPIIDAGMRELNQTGFMQNRVRMIVASFLVKDLHIDWRLGEKYFATKLVDYDPSVNNGNWQWSASTGCDAQPYFRIFNPWIQQKKFDRQCSYIKKWIPELKNLDAKIIHNPLKLKMNKTTYPNPIIDHKKERLVTLKLFKNLRRAKHDF